MSVEFPAASTYNRVRLGGNDQCDNSPASDLLQPNTVASVAENRLGAVLRYDHAVGWSSDYTDSSSSSNIVHFNLLDGSLG